MTGDNAPKKQRRTRISVHEMAVFAMLGTLMFVSKQVMEGIPIPNIHLLGVLTVAYTVVYRVKALIPIYVFVLLEGAIAGFHLWWIPYIYIWTILWGAVMLLPKKMKPEIACVVYPVVCCLHGLAFGTLYAPAHVIMFLHGDFSKMIPWIAAGFPYDVSHAIGNLTLGTLIYPLILLLTKLEKLYGKASRG